MGADYSLEVRVQNSTQRGGRERAGSMEFKSIHPSVSVSCHCPSFDRLIIVALAVSMTGFFLSDLSRS